MLRCKAGLQLREGICNVQGSRVEHIFISESWHNSMKKTRIAKTSDEGTDSLEVST